MNKKKLPQVSKYCWKVSENLPKIVENHWKFCKISQKWVKSAWMITNHQNNVEYCVKIDLKHEKNR